MNSPPASPALNSFYAPHALAPHPPAEAGFGGPLNAYELTKHLIEAGAAGGECCCPWLLRVWLLRRLGCDVASHSVPLPRLSSKSTCTPGGGSMPACLPACHIGANHTHLPSLPAPPLVLPPACPAVHFEDQLSSEKKCGHLGGKVLVPTQQAVRNLVAGGGWGWGCPRGGAGGQWGEPGCLHTQSLPAARLSCLPRPLPPPQTSPSLSRCTHPPAHPRSSPAHPPPPLTLPTHSPPGRRRGGGPHPAHRPHRRPLCLPAHL